MVGQVPNVYQDVPHGKNLYEEIRIYETCMQCICTYMLHIYSIYDNIYAAYIGKLNCISVHILAIQVSCIASLYPHISPICAHKSLL